MRLARAAFVIPWLVGAAACADAAPPFDELTLRDALEADPAAIASMPEEARARLAARLRNAPAEQGALAPEGGVGDSLEPEGGGKPDAQELEPDAEPDVQPDAEPDVQPDVEEALLALDGARAEAGEDALVAASLDLAGEPALRAARAGGKLSLAELGLAVEGLDPLSPTAEEESRALAGEAGTLVAALAEEAGAERVVRIASWPVGALRAGDAVYVNATWLVAMAALEARSSAPPSFAPLGVPGNPYDPPASVAACADAVRADCDACLEGRGCGPSDLGDMPDPQAACAYLRAEPSRSAALCALVLLELESVSACVEDAEPACSVPSTARVSSNLASAGAFLESAECRAALDACLAEANGSGRSGGGFGSSGGGSGASVCAVVGKNASPGRRALWLFGPLLFVLALGRRGTWKKR